MTDKAAPFYCPCMDAIMVGDFDKFKTTLAIREEPITTLHVTAIREGHIDMLKYMIENDHPLKDVFVYCHHASIANQFDMLKFLRSEQVNARWDEWTIIWAAHNDRIDMVVWALENGCPFHKEFTEEYLLLGTLERLVKWHDALANAVSRKDCGKSTNYLTKATDFLLSMKQDFSSPGECKPFDL